MTDFNKEELAKLIEWMGGINPYVNSSAQNEIPYTGDLIQNDELISLIKRMGVIQTQTYDIFSHGTSPQGQQQEDEISRLIKQMGITTSKH